jgi:nucleoid DNA-binding protein
MLAMAPTPEEPMNKSELVRVVAKHSDVRGEVVKDVINSLWDVMAMTLAVEEDITIRGFGKLEPRVRPPVQLKNPQTGEPILVSERRTVVFLPSTRLKGRLNGEL